MTDSVFLYSVEQVDDLRRLLAKSTKGDLDFPISVCVSPAAVTIEALPVVNDNIEGRQEMVRLAIEKDGCGKKSVTKEVR